VSQGFGGAGVSTSSILKSPSDSRATPDELVLLALAVAAGPQKSVAKTLCPPFVPMPLPPARSRPRPRTRMCPSISTSASRSGSSRSGQEEKYLVRR